MHEDDVLIAVHKIHDRFGGMAAKKRDNLLN